MCVSNNKLNLDNLSIESKEQGESYQVKTSDIYDMVFKPVNGEGNFRLFYFVTDESGKRVGVRFNRTGARIITYTYIPGEGLFLGKRKVNKAKVLPTDMHNWIYEITKGV